MSQRNKNTGHELLRSIAECDFVTFYFLLSEGCDTDYQLRYPCGWWIGYTALMWACEKNMLREVKALISAGCNLDLQNTDGDTALILASHKGNVEIVRELVKNGCNMDVRNEQGDYALSKTPCNKVATLLIKSGCNIELRDANNDTPLIKHAWNNEYKTVSTLIDGGCNLDTQGFMKRTALIQACIIGHHSIITLLLKSGCNPFIKDVGGKTALGNSWSTTTTSLVTKGMKKYNNENFKKMCLILKITKDVGNVWYGLPIDIVRIIFRYSGLRVYKIE